MKHPKGFLTKRQGTKGLALLSMLFLAMLWPINEAPALFIDHFDVPQARLQLTATGDIGNEVHSTVNGTNNLYGSYRYIQIFMANGTADQVESADVSVASSIYSFGQDPSVNGTGTIRYAGNANETLNNLNLSLIGGDRFILEFNYVDQQFTFNMVVTDSTGTKTATVAKTIPPWGPPGPPSTFVTILFSEFTGTLNFQTDIIGNIRAFWTTTAVDFQLHALSAPLFRIDCVSKTINGLKNYVYPTPPDFTLPLTIEIVVKNEGDDANVTIEDKLPVGMTYLGAVSDTPNILGPPDTSVFGLVKWTSKASQGGGGILPSGATLSLIFTVNQAEFPVGETKTDCAIAYVAELTPPAACSDSSCIATASRTSIPKVPALNEWGAIMTIVLLAGAGFYLIRRRKA